ncbi:MAG: aminoacyl-tRNA hydrolase [Chloroflexi bacterium]|nr:aminoacyl-tRNA hydrolase [Chloroflexota bacterium]
MAPLKMIVGLGNPGPQYKNNRHNIGFQCIDLFAHRHNLELGKMQMQARIGDGWVERRAQGPVQRQKVLLVKPLTYMNASGQPVAQLMRFYKVAQEDLIVIHDDLDLDAGKLRLRANGSSGGQNGIKSIIEQVGSPEFARIRVGIGRPPGRMDPAAYVLQDFSKADEENFGVLREKICDALECWLFEGLPIAMNKFNG